MARDDLKRPLSLDSPLTQVELYAIDLETTGLDPWRGHRICEIALRSRDGRDALITLVHPERPIPPAASALHGILDEHVACSPRFEQLAPTILETLQDRVLLGYHIGFDLRFLAAELRRSSIRLPRVWAIDIMALATYYLPKTLDRTLRTLTQRTHHVSPLEPGETLHRASADTAATLAIFEHIVQVQDLSTLRDCFAKKIQLG